VTKWQEYLLEDVVDKFIDYRGKTPTKTSSGVPLITAKVVKAGKILTPNEFIAIEDYDGWMKRGLPEIDDVVLTTEAPLGEVALIKDKNVALAQRIITLRGKKEFLHNPFLKYYFQNETGQHELQSRASGTTVFGIKASVLKKVPIEIPALEEQKAIASVLSSLDDKIDLIHRQNTTLERMAETLFRLWFIEEAQDSNISQFIDLQNGYAFKSQDFKDTGDHRVLKIKNISGGIIDVNNSDFLDASVTNKTDEKFKVVTGDILFAMTGAEIGKLGIVPKTNTPLWLNQRVGLLKEKYKGARFLAYLQLNSDIGQDYIENSATGSAQPNISGSLIEQCPFSKVDANHIKECAEILDVYYQKLISNLGQIQTLEKLRDNLLPKLMNGEVKVING